MAPPTTSAASTLAFNIREGEIEGTDIGGLKVVRHRRHAEGHDRRNWRLGVFIDERATDEQSDKLVQVFSGQLGGPMAALAPLVGECSAWSARRSR